MIEQLKHAMDGVSGLAVLASLLKLMVGFFQALPTILTIISGIMAIIWYWIRISEFLKTKKDIDQ